jgi:hypothetical protein
VDTALPQLALSPRRPASVQRLSDPLRRLCKDTPDQQTAFTPMARLEHAITALDVLGSVVQVVPVVGENLKSATEIAKKICEMAKVSVLLSSPCMCVTLHAEDEGEPRGIRATRGSRCQAARGCREHYHKGQPREDEGHGGEFIASAHVRHKSFQSHAST